jgi:GGDEF domain-containing protein
LPLLLPTRSDLTCGQHKSVCSRISQLDRVCIVGLASTVDVVDTISRRGIQGTAGWAERERLASLISNRLRGHRRKRDVFAVIGGEERAVVSVRREDVLAVGVPVDVELDALGVAEFVDISDQTLVFGAIAGCESAEGVVTWVRRGAGGVGVPLEGPIAVDIPSITG